MRYPASLASRLSGEGALDIYTRAQELERTGLSVIHLELGEPDFRPTEAIQRALTEAVAAGHDRYCAPRGLPLLREMVAAYLATTRDLFVDPGNIVITPGCKAALFLAMMAVVEPGDEVFYPEPGFPIYSSLTRALGAVPVPYHLSAKHNFQPDPEEIVHKITKRSKLLITNSPHNPTGSVYDPHVQQCLSELAIEHDLFVLSDEIYARILYGGTYTSIGSYPGMSDRTLVLDGFSKCFAMTGWRLGYVVAPFNVVPTLEMLIVNTFTCVAEFIQYAALTALRDSEGFVQAIVKDLTQRREHFVSRLNTIPGFLCVPPAGAFYAWVNVSGTGIPSKDLCELMLQRARVACSPGGAFGSSGEDFVRFCFAAAPGRLLNEAVGRISELSVVWQ